MLLRAAENKRAPPLWGALIMLAWTNLHGSFPLAIPIGAAIAFDALRGGQVEDAAAVGRVRARQPARHAAERERGRRACSIRCGWSAWGRCR